MKTHENAFALKFSEDESQLLTSDNKVFAIKEEGATTYTIVTPPGAPNFITEGEGGVCIRVTVEVGIDKDGNIIWKVVVVCEPK